jgi:hypothetical protein
MNIAKNMETIFIAALALASVTSLANASAPAHQGAAPIAQQAPAATMMVVTTTGKRLSAVPRHPLSFGELHA